ncbi:MAG: Protease HtpX [Phycisphaerae bacterium]|nr:Protease HtpX [Phycisphaerae bacterium]
MADDFYQLIDRNKRNSLLLMAVFIALVAVVAWVIGLAWGRGDWRVSVAVGGVAAAISFLIALASYYGGASAVLAMSGAREIAKEDDPQLFNVVEEMSIAAGVPMPRIYIVRDDAPNAFATGRDPKHAAVAITTGLRSKLTRDELQGVMAHEMGHVRNFDIRYAMLVAIMVGVIVMLCDMFLRSMWWGGGRRRRSSSRQGKGGGAQAVIMVIAILLAIIAPILAKLIQMAVSRQREYLADATAVRFTRNPLGLASALQRIAADPDPLDHANRGTQHMYIVNPLNKASGQAGNLFSTHPPLEDRIARLRALAHEYPQTQANG